MLRAIALAATFVVAVPSISAFAEPNGNSASGASTTSTESGTTTYFGKSSDPKEAQSPSKGAAAAKTEPVVKPRPLPPTLTASVDLSRQTMTVSVNGEPRYRWTISSGASQYPTPTGSFYPQWTSKMWYSKKYDNAPMPNAVFINGGVAVHGTYHLAALGMPASHGCIRLAPANAKTFYNLVQQHGLQRTRVTVHGRPNYRDAVASRRDSRRDYDYANNDAGWFWGASASDDLDARELRKRDRKGYTYVYIDGKRTKVYRRKDGQYVLKDGQKRRRYSQTSSNYSAN
ncbi:L,D-transpeptidase [Hyphomicrobium sp.]|uniref:L,D-transpeptidase n=1 Tax=Hyphomicrobium sp. TaxID=82 RepID=UPI000FAB7BA3|nr:L,D-transpeptidase [Hyphomicrobium sp.]RUP00662.1 MAG: L,D-transpeptidase [Hyphomicrobium sp.]